MLVLIEEPEEDGSISKEYSRWVAVVVSRRLTGLPRTRSRRRRARCTRQTPAGSLCGTRTTAWRSWLRLPGDINNNARGSWRVDLDFEASGGIEGGGGGGGDERGRRDSGGGDGGNGDEPEEESGKEENGDESEDDDSSDDFVDLDGDEDEDEDEDEDGDN